MPKLCMYDGTTTHEVPCSTDKSVAAPDEAAVLSINIDGTTYYAYAESEKGGNAVATFQYNDSGDTSHLVTEHAPSLWEIYTADDLQSWAEYMRTNNNYSIDAILYAEINMDGITWTPIGTEDNPYTGYFDGNSNAIHSLSIRADMSSSLTNFGFFGAIGEGGKVNHLTLEVMFGYNTTDKDKNPIVFGAIAARNAGSIGNCTATGAADINGSDWGTTPPNLFYVGGAVGINDGYVEGITSYTNISYNYNMISDNGNNYVGGIVGYNNGTVNGSTYGSMLDFYVEVTEGIAGDQHLGGITGYNSATGAITNCTNGGTVSAPGDMVGVFYNAYLGGIIGTNEGTLGDYINSGTPSNAVGQDLTAA